MVEEKWTDVALPKEQFDDLVRIGSFGGDIEWNKFFALACSALAEVRSIFTKFNRNAGDLKPVYNTFLGIQNKHFVS